MKQVHNFPSNLDHDSDGSLFDPRVRSAMARFTEGGDTLALEGAGAVRSAFHAVERLRARGTEGRGLSAGALDLLVRLSAVPGEGISIGELAQAAGVSSRNVTGLVDTLERDGLVERVPDRRDRRSVLARITPAGLTWLESFRRPTQVAMAAVFHGFTPAELTQLRHLCLRLVENQHRLDQHLGRADGTTAAQP
ncbi:MarR family winged helix-turn-helix transcriptional regulator [Kitasatospora sp. NPDC056327]|uniref:MarR family winged helix-turn-helix transcriptional regulator n=1 Tax=Kitasatospora sp. NPDC056327 TaxID=3345785 RepID=UPI0035D7D378